MSDVMELVRDKKKVAEPTISFFKLLYEQLKDKDWTEEINRIEADNDKMEKSLKKINDLTIDYG